MLQEISALDRPGADLPSPAFHSAKMALDTTSVV